MEKQRIFHGDASYGEITGVAYWIAGGDRLDSIRTMENQGGRRGPQSDAGYRYSGLSYRVASANPADVRWLDEFLQPHYRRAPPAPDAIEVALVIDTARFERLAAAFSPSEPCRASSSTTR